MAMTVTTSVLPVGEVGVPYTVTLAETGGVAPITWTKASGTIPTGLTLADSTGIVSGTPTVTASAAAVEFEATDSTPVTPQTADSSGLTFTIYAALAISTMSLPNAFPTQAYSSTLATTGGNGAVTWAVTAGTLPAGLVLHTGTGVVFGTPTANAATATVTITATDALGGTSSQSLTITVPTEVVRNFNSSMAAFPGIPLVSIAGSSLPDVGTPANYAAQVQGGWENEGSL